MNLIAQVLEDRFVRLEPMTEAHREPLRAACAADADIWRDLYPYSMAGAEFDPTFDQRRNDQAQGRLMPFAVIVDGACAGMTSFGRIDSANAVLEIGGTYYRPDHRGGPVNPAAKRLMLHAAFAAGARRVAFNVDALNLRSRAAVLKLGATEEGILRQDRVCWTGRVRDTVIFSILTDEWPAVRDRLDARLAGFRP